MNVALDTNLLAYAEGLNGRRSRQQVLDLLQALPPESTFIPMQALGELFHVLVRKAGRSKADAAAAVLGWGDVYPLIETSSDVMMGALALAGAHQFGTWDAVMLSAAANGKCRLLLSEDLQDGFTWHGVTVTNPLAPSRHPLLEALLDPT